MITIVDYKVGNLGSISNMLKKIGSPSIITSNKEEIRKGLDEGSGLPQTDKETFLKLRERRNHW